MLHNKRTEFEGYTPRLHTAQLLLTLIVQDRNPQSQGYGDFIWLNISLYDERKEFTDLYASQDTADPSAKMIYAPAEPHLHRKVATRRRLGNDPIQRPSPDPEESTRHGPGKRLSGQLPNAQRLRHHQQILGWEIPGVERRFQPR